MKKNLLLSLIFSLFVLYGCDNEKSVSTKVDTIKYYNHVALPGIGEKTPDTENTGQILELTSQQMEMVKSSNQLGVELFASIYANDREQKSIIFSPYSFDQAVGMLAAGYDEKDFEGFMHRIHMNGISQEDYLHYLHQLTESMQKSDRVCRIFPANAMWVKSDAEVSLKKDYAEKLLKGFNAELSFLSFNPNYLSYTINQWIDRMTYGHIKDITKPKDFTDGNYFFVLSNAVYFKAPWGKTDNSSKIKLFTDNNGQTKEVKTVISKSDYSYYENNEVQMISVPTDNEAYAVVLLLPKDEKAALNPEKMIQWNPISHLFGQEKEKYNVQLEFPFVHLTPPNIDIVKNGKKLIELPKNLTNAFGNLGNDVMLSIWQKSFVSWDDVSVEAAAATIVSGANEAASPSQDLKKAVMHVNHPFFFMIVHQASHKILFIGAVNQL